MLTGGFGSENKCEMFDCERNKWSPLPDLNQGRYAHSSAAFNGDTVYVFCGTDASLNDINSIERWAVGEQMWTTIQTKGDTLKEKEYHKSVQVDDKFILVFGGEYDKTSFKFYPEDNTVKRHDDMIDYCAMASIPEPFYDEITQGFFVCS